MERARAGGVVTGATLAVLGAWALGCGLAREEAAAPLPAQPLPVVMPSALLGTWVATTRVEEREVLAWPCAGSPLTLALAQGGPVSLRGRPDGPDFEAALTMAELEPDGAVLLTTDRGTLRLQDRDEGTVWAQGSLPGFAEGRLLANPAADAVEQVYPAAASCGATVSLAPLSSLSAGRFNQRGDPCVAAGLALDLSPRRPVLTRASLPLGIEAVQQTERGTWLTLSDPTGGLHGLRLVPLEDGSVQVWQRLDTGMASETLRAAGGLCGGPPR